MAFDVSMGKSYMVIYKNEQCIEEREFSHSQKNFDLLLPFLKEHEVEIVFEATGVYSKPLEHYFRTHHLGYCCMNPLEAKLQMATMRQRKTDKTDAHNLTQSHFKFTRPPTVRDPEVYQELTALSKKKTGKRLSKEQAKNKALWILDLAETAYSTVDVDHFLVTEVRYRVGVIRDLVIQKEKFRKELVFLASKLEEFKLIESIPGIGKLTAALLISELGDIRRFQSNKQLNAYVGIDIRTYQSGTIHYRDRIQKRGNSRARMIAYFTIQNMLKKQALSQNHFIDYYYKLKKDPYAKKHRVAMIACMNKLLKTIHYLVLNEKEYDYSKSPQS